MDLPGHRVDVLDFGNDEACVRKTAQRCQIDVSFVVCVVSRDEARQHAGVRRMGIRRYERQLHARDRSHAKPFENGDMGVPAANEDDVLDDRYACLLLWVPSSPR